MSKRLIGSLLAAAGLGVGLLVGPLAMEAGAQPQPQAAPSNFNHCAVIPLAGGLDVTICISLTI
jgi:hypothetical protein